MHEGRTLHNLVKIDDRNANEIAEKLGITRQHLYKIYKLPKLSPYYVDKLRQIGIVMPGQSATNVSNLLRVETASNGKSKHIIKSEIGNLSSLRKHEGTGMGEVINLSLPELLQLQREGQHDDEMKSLIAKLVYYQEKIKDLQEKNQLLKDNLADLRAKKK